MAKPGFFITIEGGEGAGKSELLKRLAFYFTELTFNAEFLNDPSRQIPECVSIRKILLDKDSVNLTPGSELLLYLSARRILDVHKIAPAMRAGKIVVCDRYSDSTLTYQGYARNRLPSVKRTIKSTGIGIVPDLTLLLDVDPLTGIKRSKVRLSGSGGPDESRFENMDLSFHHKVRAGYLKIAKKNPKRVHVINANLTQGEVWGQVEVILDTLNRRIRRMTK